MMIRVLLLTLAIVFLSNSIIPGIFYSENLIELEELEEKEKEGSEEKEEESKKKELKIYNIYFKSDFLSGIDYNNTWFYKIPLFKEIYHSIETPPPDTFV